MLYLWKTSDSYVVRFLFPQPQTSTNVRLEYLTAMPAQTVKTVKVLTTVFVNLDLQEMGQLVQVSKLEMGKLLGLTFLPLTN